MGTPAMRITDQTAHGGIVVMGCPTVIIGNMPASRIGDMHTCPMFTGLVPHVGGPFIMGSFTVIVGGMPQSRVGDMLICVGPPDTAVKGEPTVLVGMVGAAGFLGALKGLAMAGVAVFERLFSSTSAFPYIQQNPDGTFTTQFSPAITIGPASRAYNTVVVQDLQALKAPLPDGRQSTGGKLLQAYSETGKHVTIAPIPRGQDQANGFEQTSPASDAVVGKALPNPDGSPGSGANAQISYNPSLTMTYKGEDGNNYSMPPHDILGHEMTHALHDAEGENLIDEPDPMDPGDNKEEAQTIGVHGFENEQISERNLSMEAGRSPRPNHNSVEGMEYQDDSGVLHDMQKNPTTGQMVDTTSPAPPGSRPNH